MARRKLKSPKAVAAELERFSQRAYRERLRARMTELRQKVREVRRDEKRALVQVRSLCSRSRARARAWYRESRKELLAALKAEASKRMAAARAACEKRAGQVERRGAKLRAELEREAHRIATELAGERMYRELQSGSSRSSRTSRAERRTESDDEVRRNLEPDLVPVFDQVRKSIHGSPKHSRTEAFLHWAEEHPEDVIALRAELGDRAFQRELREHLEHQKQIQKLLKKKRIKASELEALGISAADVAAAGLDPSRPDEVRAFLEGPAIEPVREEDMPF